MDNAGHSEESLPENEPLSRSQRTSCQTKSQTVSQQSQAVEDSKITNDFKKVGQLDIAVHCSICEQKVHIKQLFHHKKAHHAQATLDYQHPWTETIDINKIALRRQQLISNMMKTSTYTERAREKIGCSVEFLKESLKIAPYFCINSIVQSSVQVREVSSPLIKAIAICQDKNTLWHSELQDAFVVLDNYGNRSGVCFLGLFDGSNGASAAETTSVELPILFLEQLSSGDNSYQVSETERQVLDSFRTVFRADYKMRERVFTVRNTALKDKNTTSLPSQYEWIHRAYAKSFWRMDRLLRLGRNEISRVCWSSCTATTCLVETLSNARQQQQQDQKVKEKLGRSIHETEQVITQQEKPQPERIIISVKKQSNIDEQGVALLLSNQKTEGTKMGEELKIIKEEEPSVSEEEYKELPPTNKDITRGKDLPESNHSTAQPNESSFGVTDIASSTEEQGVAHFLSDQKTESLKTDDDDEELKRIEDMSVSEQEDKEVPSPNEDSTREKDLLEKDQSTAQPDASSFGVMDIAKNIEEQGVAPLFSDQKMESLRSDDKEDELKRIKEEDDTGVSEEEDKEVPLSSKSIRQRNLLENDHSTAKSAESSFGEMDIANNTEEQGEAPLLSDQKTEGMKTEEEEILERLTEDMSVSEQEDKIANDKDSSRKKVLLDNNSSTAQPDENSFGVMHIANIGNVHAILCKNGKSYWLTKEHTTHCNEEKARVLEKGGYISTNEPNGLVEGLVRTTRGLGHHGNPTLKKTVIPVPHTMSFLIDGSCQFLILASNGLWEVLDKSEVATLTLIMFSAYLKKYQQTQQEKKCRTVDEVEEDVISWYFNPEVFSSNTENNQNQNNANLGPPANNSSEEGDKEPPGSFSENSEVEKLGDIAEVTESSEDTSSTTTEETTEPGSQEGSKESSKSTEEKVLESSSGSFSEISEDEEANPKTFYNHAAKYISKHLVKAALKAGSRDNITVLVALLNGCDKMPTYI